MGNRFTFLLEYYQYIENIESLSILDDFDMYKNFKHQILIEGLIKTHPLNISANIIKKRFPNLIVKVEKDGKIYIEGDMLELKNYIPLFNNLGYFISMHTINGSEWLKEYTDETKPVALYLEPKYDLKIDNIPKILYHASPIKFRNKISKIGFIPKTGNKLSKHPDRIYLTENIEIANYFGENIKKEYNTGYCIYEINGECISNLYSDINLRNGGYYTNGNIRPECFKLIKEVD